MNRSAVIVLAVLVAVSVAAGAYVVVRQTGGGGQARTFNLDVKGGTMSPDHLDARQGDTITINLTADRAEEIHLHGFDLKFEAEPGKTVTRTFKADRTCDCEIEIEDSSTHLGSLTVKP
jgi:FtsP/CotA-like multicopper oxidase with cupredoxin domain